MSDTSDSKQRLLIVDDSRVIRVSARKILQDHFETVEAVDGNNAWEILNNEEPFSLVVSDLTMPGLDGFGLLEKIRNSHLPHLCNLPVIIITGANDSEPTKKRATDAGATDFIGKPFDAVHLLARTQAHSEAYATELSLTQETMELEDQALNDQLSGLPNETAFMERGFQQLAYAVRHKSGLALFCIEVDDFGDHYAQHGDEVTGNIVKSVAGLLNSCIRQEDMAARIGTARFALLLPGMNNAGIRNLADRILKEAGEQRISAGEKNLGFTVSIGVVAPEITGDIRLNTLLSSATGSLQAAVNRGGNRIAHADFAAGTGSPPQYDQKPAKAGPETAAAEIVNPAQPPFEPAPEAETESMPDLELVGTEEATAGNHEPARHSDLTDTTEYYEEEETIIITAPGDYYLADEQPQSTATDEQVEISGAATSEGTAATDVENTALAAQATTEIPAESPDSDARPSGFLSRLWSLLTRKI